MGDFLNQQMEKGFFGCPFKIDIERDEPIFTVVDLAQCIGELVKQRRLADAAFTVDHDAVVVQRRDDAL